MKIYHVIYEDGAWSLWFNGRVVGRYHTREEAEIAAQSL